MSSVIEERTEPMGDGPRSWGLNTPVHMKTDHSHVLYTATATTVKLSAEFPRANAW